MQSFNSELKVGMQAMVIGCKHPENSWIIGRVVTIEALFVIGESVPYEFRSPLGKLTPPERRGKFAVDVAIVSGYHTNPYMAENHGISDRKYLMPFPPLDDDAIIESTETPKETSKC